MPVAARSSLAPLLLLALPIGCTEEIDHAAQHQHELIDHEYDRKEQLVDLLFANWHETIEHHYDRQVELFDTLIDAEFALFDRVLEAGPPPGFGPSTCRFTSEPSGAEVFQENLFGEWEFVGKTPLVVERPLTRARRIEVRADGHAPKRGYMLSDEVRGPCEEHFELGSL